MPGIQRTGNKHYDIAVLGDSLAGRLTATLAAKKGCHVLSVHNNKELQVPWLTSSHLLERILGLLDGRSCSTKPFPFQVITKNQRINFNDSNPLTDELRRELPEESEEIATFLDDMSALGENLEELLWEHHGFPTTGLGNRLKFKKTCFSSDVPSRAFRQTLRDRVAVFNTPGARKLLSALFCGFAFKPSNKLTLAECALVWGGLGHKSGVVKNGLEELLWHRYRQFHGEEEALFRLARVRDDKSGLTTLVFENGETVTCDHLVFADREKIALCEGIAPPPTGRITSSHLSVNLMDRISPLLHQNVIVDGNPPLRLNFEKSDTVTRCRVENAAISDGGLSSPEKIETRLQKIIPFVDLDLTPLAQSPHSDMTISSEENPVLMSAYEKIVFDHGRKFLCSGSEVIPELGSVGEVLVAITVTGQLLKATGNPPLQQKAEK